MPWSSKNPPPPAKNWPPAAKSLCVRVANGVLKRGGSDRDAVIACIGAVKKGHPGAIGKKSNVENSADAHIAQFYALPTITLKEEGGRYTSRIPVLPEGKFKHPWYGDLDFTAPVLRAAKRNFEKRTLGVDIMVDEGHDRGKALGWFKNVHHGASEIGGQEHIGLFADIEWTDEGRSLLERDIYRYFSAEIGSFTGPDGKTIKNVLFGGGLTNRPFFKQMPAVKFGEGEAQDRYTIGLFSDGLWEFDESPSADREDEERSFFIGYEADPDTDEDLEDEDTEEEDDDTEEGDMKYADLISKLNKEFGLTLSEEEETTAEAVEHAFSSQAVLARTRKKFSDAGFKFDNGADIADVVLAGYNTLKAENTENTTAIAAIRKELDDTKAATAVDKLVESGKLPPAKRESYVKLFNTNHELFDDLTKDMEPYVKLGEIGGDGIPQEPGHGTMDKFLEPAKATDEADRYMGLVPQLEDRLAAKKGK